MYDDEAVEVEDATSLIVYLGFSTLLYLLLVLQWSEVRR